ncbi:hypothetical protein [Novosphingobium fuchskuhlense]|uniref:hypothetical protein n=1 Tax=Novosphingobium fuchskuhlense TaxID=1117702 RepID=UPI001969B39E|nr:hypothetical protein [Novosphingobium fuchskuhlense]
MCLTSTGDIAVAVEPYAQEQDVASECRLILGEAWYDTTIGIPYITDILGRAVPVQLIKEYLVAAAKRVPGVANVTVYLSSITARGLSGQVQFNGGATTL